MSAARFAWPGVAVSAVLAGCAIGPDYERPEIQAPELYLQSIDEGASIANLPWWELFDDPQLDALVAAALEENKDLAIATARVEEARAQLGFVRADQFPTIDAGGSGARGEDNSLQPGVGITERWVLAGTLSYEIDLWGRLRRQTEAARAELLATEEARRTVIITLVSDVASTYLLLRDLDARREIAERTVASREESLRIIRSRFDQGTVPLIDVNQAEIEAADAAARLAAIERDRIRAENLLSVLLGRNPGSIVRGRELREQRPPPAVPAGLPSELLERRPDVREAEQRLAAQTARIGAAQALRLPTLNLTGAFGVASSDLSDLIDSDSDLWSIGGDFFGPLFDSGRSKRRVEAEKARTEQLLRTYEQTILLALREVEDALAAVRTSQQELDARERQVAAARSAAALSRSRYDGGVTSYLEVLDSERSLFQSELVESTTRRERLVAVVGLYKALGGGWLPDEPAATAR